MNISLNTLFFYLSLALCSTVILSCQQQRNEESILDTIKEVAHSPEYAELRTATEDMAELMINNDVDVEAFYELAQSAHDRSEGIPKSALSNIAGGELYYEKTNRILAAQKALENKYQYGSLLVDHHKDIRDEYQKANGGPKVFLPPSGGN